MCRQNHGVSVDYFAAGVMAFECMFGRVSNISCSWHIYRDHTLERQDKKSGITFYQNKSK